jgi:voltage-gated potassium channel
MSDGFGLLSDLDEKYRPVGKKNIGVMAGGGTTNNSFTLRISYSVTTWSDRWAPVVVEMAKIIKQHLEAEDRSEFTEQPSWKEQGCGYGENEQDNQ